MQDKFGLYEVVCEDEMQWEVAWGGGGGDSPWLAGKDGGPLLEDGGRRSAHTRSQSQVEIEVCSRLPRLEAKVRKASWGAERKGQCLVLQVFIEEQYHDWRSSCLQSLHGTQNLGSTRPCGGLPPFARDVPFRSAGKVRRYLTVNQNIVSSLRCQLIAVTCGGYRAVRAHLAGRSLCLKG